MTNPDAPAIPRRKLIEAMDFDDPQFKKFCGMISRRAMNIMIENEITSIRKLRNMTLAALLRTPNCGLVAASEIIYYHWRATGEQLQWNFSGYGQIDVRKMLMSRFPDYPITDYAGALIKVMEAAEQWLQLLVDCQVGNNDINPEIKTLDDAIAFVKAGP